MAVDTATTAELLGLFPPGSRVDADGELVVAGCRLADLAATWGTPLYVVDETAVRAQVRRVRRALEDRWDNSRMVFASKAYPCTAMYRLMADEGVGVDVAGAGELVMALAGGVDPARIVMHGNAKTTPELRMAVEAGVGLIVIDNTDDIDRLEKLVSAEQSVLVRIIPGVRPDTYEAVATGQAGSKFGLPIPAARAAIARLRHSDKLRIEGVHAHIGSQILATEPYAREVEAIAGLGDFAVYNLGGGLGVRYTYTDCPPAPEDWIGVLTEAARRHLPRDAQLVIEPGRMLVAPFGVTVYRVVSVKGDTPRFVAVDGGMADNMEVALYGQRFEAAVTGRVGGGDSVELVGRHCESGDRLISGVALRDPQPGDLVAVAVTGAYCYTMANNYNGAMRPPVVFCADGAPRLVVRRETYADFLSRDVISS
jgi:diaminopimelate decarboxylase